MLYLYLDMVLKDKIFHINKVGIFESCSFSQKLMEDMETSEKVRLFVLPD
jgi:hypothetical protein